MHLSTISFVCTFRSNVSAFRQYDSIWPWRVRSTVPLFHQKKFKSIPISPPPTFIASSLIGAEIDGTLSAPSRRCDSHPLQCAYWFNLIQELESFELVLTIGRRTHRFHKRNISCKSSTKSERLLYLCRSLRGLASIELIYNTASRNVSHVTTRRHRSSTDKGLPSPPLRCRRLKEASIPGGDGLQLGQSGIPPSWRQMNAVSGNELGHRPWQCSRGRVSSHSVFSPAPRDAGPGGAPDGDGRSTDLGVTSMPARSFGPAGRRLDLQHDGCAATPEPMPLLRWVGRHIGWAMVAGVFRPRDGN